MGNRMSSLPISRYCPKASALSEQYGSGRSAAMGTTFHALCSDPKSEETLRLCKRLTDEEMQEIMLWHKPADVELEDGQVLKYADAMKEFEVALDEQGNYTEDLSKAVTVGHVDCAWIVEVGDWGRKVAYVPDLKRSSFTVKDGVESLQLKAYGRATALKFGCEAYVPGIWACEDGHYMWGPMVDLDSPEAEEDRQLIIAAATHTEGTAISGPHCTDTPCYGRSHCPEHLLPAMELIKHGELETITEGTSMEMDNEAALKLLTLAKSTETALKVMQEAVKAHAKRLPIVDEEAGKHYCASQKKGRKSLDRAGLEKEYPGILKEFEKVSGPITSMGWRKI